MTFLRADSTFTVVEVSPDDYASRADETDVFVNIAILIDAEGILADYGNPNPDPSQPIDLGDNAKNYLTMAARHRSTADQWGYELTISLPVGSTVRWREATMSLNTQYRAQLYHYESNDPSQQLLSKPIARTRSVNLPLPNDKDPLKPSLYPGHDYYWTADGLNPGYVTYHWRFMILDKDNHQLGYYTWDPYVHVTS